MQRRLCHFGAAGRSGQRSRRNDDHGERAGGPAGDESRPGRLAADSVLVFRRTISRVSDDRS